MPTSDKDLGELDRRTVTKLLGSVGIASIAGCAGGDNTETGTEAEQKTTAGETRTTVPEETPTETSEIDLGGTLTFFENEIAPSLDAHQKKGYGTAEQYIPYDNLFSYDQDLGWEFGLATDIQIPDNQTYVFPLREGVTFHDGSEWDAEVAKWNFERLQSEYSGESSNLSVIDTVEASGSMEITIHLSEPFAPFLDNLNSSAYFVSREALEGKENEWMQKNPVGSGAFKFESWDTQNNVVRYVKNEDYWRTDEEGNQLPYLDEWVFRAVPEGSTRVSAYKENGNYVHGVPAESVEELRESEDHTVVNSLGQSNTIDYLAMNTDKGPFQDPKLREAVFYAIDNKRIREFIPDTEKIVGPLPGTNWGSNPNLEPKHDVEQAKSLMEEAGHGDGFSVTLKIWSNDQKRQQLATVTQNMLAEIGIQVEIEVLETQTLIQQLSKNEWEFASVHWGGGGHLDPYGNLHVLFHSEGQFNWITNFSDEEVDNLLDQALTTTDRETRKEHYQAAEKRIFEAHPMIWFGRFKSYISHYDEVQNVRPIQPTGYFPEYHEVWIEQDG